MCSVMGIFPRMQTTGGTSLMNVGQELAQTRQTYVLVSQERRLGNDTLVPYEMNLLEKMAKLEALHDLEAAFPSADPAMHTLKQLAVEACTSNEEVSMALSRQFSELAARVPHLQPMSSRIRLLASTAGYKMLYGKIKLGEELTQASGNQTNYQLLRHLGGYVGRFLEAWDRYVRSPGADENTAKQLNSRFDAVCESIISLYPKP